MLPVSMVMGQSVSAGRLDDPKGDYHIKCLQPGRSLVMLPPLVLVCTYIYIHNMYISLYTYIFIYMYIYSNPVAEQSLVKGPA